MSAVVSLLIIGALPSLTADRRPVPSSPRASSQGSRSRSLFTIRSRYACFPAHPSTTPIDAPAKTPRARDGRFDLVLDAHLRCRASASRASSPRPGAADGAGEAHRYDSNLGDGWQTRRRTARTAPVISSTCRRRTRSTTPPAARLASTRWRFRSCAPVVRSAIASPRRCRSLEAAPGGAGSACLRLWWDPHRLDATPSRQPPRRRGSSAPPPPSRAPAGVRRDYRAALPGSAAGIAAWLARRSPWTRAISQRAFAGAGLRG